MNLYFGVTVNAARGLANQVNTAVQQFASSFVTALNPQITKLYAQNNYDDMQTLLHNGIKYSFFLMYIIALPLFLETPAIVFATFFLSITLTSFVFLLLISIFYIIMRNDKRI